MIHEQPKPAPVVHDTDRLDQHFLSSAAAHRLVQFAELEPADCVLDIGAGSGILTAAILQHNVARVIAVEPDQQCLLHLLHLQARSPALGVEHNRIQDVARHN